MEHTVIHDEKVDRFEVFESGQIAYLQYDEKNGVLDILHTIVPPQLDRKVLLVANGEGKAEII